MPKTWPRTVANQVARRHHAAMTDTPKPAAEAEKPDPAAKPDPATPPKQVEEIGGPPGPEPTRYGHWQFNGQVTDF